MRYYDIAITETNAAYTKIGGKDAHWTSYVQGITRPGALNIEMDVPVVTLDVPAGNAYIKIWGVGLNTVNNASALNGKNITIKGGMQKGLPLATQQVTAKPVRNGVLFQGSVLQAFGNWQGSEQTLDLIVTTQLVSAPTDTPKASKPITLNVKPRGSFADAISQTLRNLGVQNPTISLDSRLVASEGSPFIANDFGELAQQLNYSSKQIITDKNYLGIKLIKTENSYFVTDNSTPNTSQGVIYFNDLIGQPTWLDFNTVQLKCVMRSDIKVGDTIQMPKANIIQGAFYSPKNNVSYTGNAWVASVRHIGNYRQQDSNSWVTILNVYPQTV